LAGCALACRVTGSRCLRGHLPKRANCTILRDSSSVCIFRLLGAPTEFAAFPFRTTLVTGLRKESLLFHGVMPRVRVFASELRRAGSIKTSLGYLPLEFVLREPAKSNETPELDGKHDVLRSPNNNEHFTANPPTCSEKKPDALAVLFRVAHTARLLSWPGRGMLTIKCQCQQQFSISI
jgi:hypothetical protein